MAIDAEKYTSTYFYIKTDEELQHYREVLEELTIAYDKARAADLPDYLLYKAASNVAFAIREYEQTERVEPAYMNHDNRPDPDGFTGE